MSLLLFSGRGVLAQSGPPASYIPWSRFLQPVALGQGLQVSPSQLAVVSQSVDGSNYIWQDEQTTLKLLDGSNLVQTMQNLNLNAWAEYSGFTGGGSFSFDYSQFNAFQGNHRYWSLDARRLWTAAIPSPVLNATAQQYQNDPATFQNLFGDYAVTGIVYRREIQVSFDAQMESSVSATQIQAAISATYGCFSGGGSVTDAQNALNVFSQVTVTATVDGPGGGSIIASGSSGDLGAIQQAVQAQLATWDTAPPAADVNDAGTVDAVDVMPYTAIPPQVVISAQSSPNQVKLITAVAEVVYLENAKARLQQIQTQDTNLNPKLQAYLFGKFKSGTYVPGALDIANADLNLELNYMQALAQGSTTATDPGIKFSFVDPDVVRWKVDAAYYAPVNGATAAVLFVEIYSNARVSPVVYGPNGVLTDSATQWGTRWYTNFTTVINNGVKEYADVAPQMLEDLSYSNHLDSVTGIPHRFAYIEWEHPPAPDNFTVQLVADDSLQYYNATDWTGWPTPVLFVPAGDWQLN